MKHNKKALHYALVAAGAIALGLTCDVASAKTVGAIAENLTTSTQGVTKAIGAVSYAAGIGLGAVAAFKLKAHKDNPQQTPLGVPLTYLIVAALLLFLPSVMKTGGDTLWGEGQGQTQGVDGGQMTIQ